MRTVRTRVSSMLLIAAFTPGVGALVTACASGRGTAPPHTARARRDLTRTQMMEQGYTDLYTAVSALRHQWLFPRGVDSFSNPGQVLVYVDDARVGGVDVLRSIQPAAVAYVRRYDAIESQARWGIGHTQGVIYIALLER